ncbi:hypothetical protein [Deinococcus pimensis]|uniref:hypothetical protein n=1 Tax=Deinococcus pimensis TaxID=309888 RepID=UPI000486A3F1|nr:hypothetical protein [Deinococcus pimensis]
MTDEQLEAIEARARKTTPGQWYPILTDDEHYMSATYVGLDPRGLLEGELYVDDGRDVTLLAEGQIDDERVVAITCLQKPRLVYQDECDGNAIFIAHAREDVLTLVQEVRRLRKLTQLNPSHSDEEE